MGSSDLICVLEDFRETVPVSRPAKFLLSALALRGFPKEGQAENIK
jgi:hypothetical protein